MRNVIVGYFLAGYPNEVESIRIMRQSVNEGLHVLEVGYPSASPSYDGEIIQSAHAVVTGHGALELSYWKKLRADIDAPIWVMAYQSDFIDSGVYRTFAEEKLCDAIVIPDASDEMRATLQKELAPQGVEVLGFAGVDTTEQTLRRIMKIHNLIYFRLYVGKTGSTNAEEGDTSLGLRVAAELDKKLFAGFGISTAERSKKLLSDGFDGVIIGTAFVKALNDSSESLYDLVSEIAEATKEGNDT